MIPIPYCTASANSSFPSSSPRSSTAPSPDPGIGLPCSSNCIPKSRPIPRRISRISPRDFLPKFLVASISRSERCTRSRIVLMLAFFNRAIQLIVARQWRPLSLLIAVLFSVFFKVDEDRHVVLDQLRGEANRVVRLDRSVRPHLDAELVVFGVLPETRSVDRVIDLLDRRVH